MPEETQRATRLRPEEIVARSFSTPVNLETNGGDGWSPKARRLFLAAMAVTGAIVVTIGLLLTGELAPGPGSPRPLETGTEPSTLSGGLLPGIEQPPATPAAAPAPTAVANQKTRSATPAAASAPIDNVDPAQPQATPTTVGPQNTQSTTPKQAQTPPTTVPCTLLGSKELGAQIPPLCR